MGARTYENGKPKDNEIFSAGLLLIVGHVPSDTPRCVSLAVKRLQTVPVFPLYSLLSIHSLTASLEGNLYSELCSVCKQNPLLPLISASVLSATKRLHLAGLVCVDHCSRQGHPLAFICTRPDILLSLGAVPRYRITRCHHLEFQRARNSVVYSLHSRVLGQVPIFLAIVSLILPVIRNHLDLPYNIWRLTSFSDITYSNHFVRYVPCNIDYTHRYYLRH